MRIGAEKAPWHYIRGEGVQASASWRTVGGKATPAARRARLAAGRGAERSRKRLPSCSISVSVNEFEVGQNIGPGDARGARLCDRPAHGGDPVLQLLFQHQREEAARDVAADGLVELVKDRARFEQALGGSKRPSHRPQTLIYEHGLERRKTGVGPQDEDAVELGVLLGLGAVDDEVAFVGLFQKRR